MWSDQRVAQVIRLCVAGAGGQRSNRTQRCSVELRRCRRLMEEQTLNHRPSWRLLFSLLLLIECSPPPNLIMLCNHLFISPVLLLPTLHRNLFIHLYWRTQAASFRLWALRLLCFEMLWKCRTCVWNALLSIKLSLLCLVESSKLLRLGSVSQDLHLDALLKTEGLICWSSSLCCLIIAQMTLMSKAPRRAGRPFTASSLCVHNVCTGCGGGLPGGFRVGCGRGGR